MYSIYIFLTFKKTTEKSKIKVFNTFLCIKNDKPEKSSNLGFLIRRDRNKRYVVNQISDARIKNIMKKENITNTIKTFSEYISIILNSLVHNRTSNL